MATTEFASYVRSDIALNIFGIVVHVMPILIPTKCSAKAYLWIIAAMTVVNGFMVSWGFDVLYSEEFVMSFMRSDDQEKKTFALWLYAFLWLRYGFVVLTTIFICSMTCCFAVVYQLL